VACVADPSEIPALFALADGRANRPCPLPRHNPFTR
jgi:hypothetical protein